MDSFDENYGTDTKEKVEPKHLCHWPGCKMQVEPSAWGCKTHWFKLPSHIRAKIWREFKPGQEITKTPSREYLAVAWEAEDWIRKNYGRRARSVR